MFGGLNHSTTEGHETSLMGENSVVENQQPRDKLEQLTSHPNNGEISPWNVTAQVREIKAQCPGYGKRENYYRKKWGLRAQDTLYSV